jgi:hypothetical protein
MNRDSQSSLAIHPLRREDNLKDHFRIQLSEIAVMRIGYVRLFHVFVVIDARICLMWVLDWVYLTYLRV